jgi:cold shock protein
MSIVKNIICKIKNLFSGKKLNTKLHGKIKFYDRKKRFGFIVSGKNEYFFHAAATNVSDFKFLKDGVEVNFVLVKGKKGLQADRIKII